MPNVPTVAKSGKGGGGSGSKGKGGGGKGQRRDGAPWSEEERQGDWDCRICGIPSNRAWRTKCRSCDSKRFLDRGGGGKAQERPPKPADPPKTFAERQLQRQRDEQREQRQRSLAANRELAAKVERLEEELARAKGDRPGAGCDGGDEGGEDCEGDEMETTNAYSSWTADERQKRLDLARAGLPYLISRHGEDSPEAEGARAEIDGIQRAAREAKPFKAHRNQLEQKKERLQKQQCRDEQELVRIQEERDSLQEKHDVIKKAVDERAKALAKIEEELTDLVKRSLAENGEGGSKPQPVIAPSAIAAMSTALQALEAMAAMPGVPPELAAILPHLKNAANGMVAAAAAAPPQASAQPQGQPQKHQQPQPPVDTGSGGANGGTGKGAGGGDNGDGGIAAAPPTQLAPQGRWARTGAASAGDAAGTQPAGGAEASAAAGGADAGGRGGNGDGGDTEAELIEEDSADAAMDVDLDKSLCKLPSADQERLRAALGARGGRRRREQTEEGEATGGRDRERSPRPLKGGNEDGTL